MTKKEIRQKYCDKRNYTSWNKYNITEYSKWLENELIKTQKKVEKLTLTDVVKSDSEQLKDKKIKDLLNWVKSDLKQETNNKISKTATPYRTEKIKFLNKLLELENL